MKKIMIVVLIALMLALQYSCNKNSNELKPVKINDVSHELTAYLNKSEYLKAKFNVYTSADIDSTIVKVEKLESSLDLTQSGFETFLVFPSDSGFSIMPGNIKEQKVNTGTKGDYKENISTLLDNKYAKYIITKLPNDPTFNFSFGGCYKMGSYHAFKGSKDTTGLCCAIFDASGSFTLWMTDATNKIQKLEGKAIETDKDCHACSWQKYGNTNAINVEFIPNKFLSKNATGELQFKLKAMHDTTTNLVDSLVFTLK